jgi:hypothetical protein
MQNTPATNANMKALLQNKTLLLLLCGFGAAVCFAVGAASKSGQLSAPPKTDQDAAYRSGGYGPNDGAASSKCCEKPPSKTALLQAR